MSSQSFSPIESQSQNPFATDPKEESPRSPTSPSSENHEDSYADMKFVLDEPWRVKILPKQEPEKLPPGVLPKPEPFNPRQQPWRPGDVTRLKEDTPEGMMKYIATHSTGWWQEMAQRALRDTERAQRRAEEAGVQYGQYWTLELDVETKEKLRLKEEARRARAEAERAKEAAAKEAFAQRQRELLEKAGRAPRCEYKYTDGRGCRAPQVRGERWCHGHAKMMSYRPERLELVPMEDEQSVAVNLYRVTKSLAEGRITEKMAGLMLWSVAIGAPAARRKTRSPQMNAERRRSGAKRETFETREQNPLTTKDTKEHEEAQSQKQNPLTTEATEGRRESSKSPESEELPKLPKSPESPESPELQSQDQNPLTTKDTKEHEVEDQNLLATEAAEQHRSEQSQEESTRTWKFVLDEPWRVTVRETLPPRNADDTDHEGGHSGVTNDNSFRFGVEGGVSPSGDLVIGRSGDRVIGNPGRTASPQSTQRAQCRAEKN